MYSPMKKNLTICVLSEDQSRGIEAKTQEELIIKKLDRDGLNPSLNTFLFLVFSPIEKEEEVLGNMRVKYILYRNIFSKMWMYIMGNRRVVEKSYGSIVEPDVIVVYNPMLLTTAAKIKHARGGKIALILTNLPSSLAQTRRLGFLRACYYRFIERCAKGIADFALTISNATKSYALSLGIPQDQIFLYSPDVIKCDERFIESARVGFVREKWNISSDKKIILSVGRLEPEKNFENLIRAFHALGQDNQVLVIVGEGKLEGKLEALTRALNIESRVVFAGLVSRKDIWNFYRDADIFILLSKSEGLGLVFWEAMYMNVPVIGSRVGGILETIGEDGERGFLWGEHDGIEALRGKIRSCLEKNEEIRAMIAHAHDYVTEKISKKTTINDLVGRI